jgi:capsular exopolysaccharide synthesis family protein
LVRLQLKKQQAREERKDPDLAAERLITVSEPTGAVSEDYRALRTSLLYALVDTPPKIISVTSPGPSEGKSTTCANLAVVLAQADKRTLIMDCDLRKPVMHRIFGVRNFVGVVNVLVEEHELGAVWQEPLPGLKVITAGSVPPNPAELLGSRRFAELIGRVREEFDYVLMDSPPIGLVTDPAIVASQGEGVLLVLDAQNTRKGALRQAMRSLEGVGANVVGTVMNNVKLSKGGYYYGSYTDE